MVSATVTVDVDPTKHDNAIHEGLYVLAALRAAGIPATGVLYVTGVESGELWVGPADLVTGLVRWSWIPG